jgi:hypothetical protein
MHALFSFLIHLDKKCKSKEDVEAAVGAEFSAYYDDHCDENNWRTLRSVAMKTGSGVWFGKHEPDPSLLQWETARKFALDCIAADMRMFDITPYGLPGARLPNPDPAFAQLRTLSFDELVTQIHGQVPVRLSQAYTQIIGTKVDPDKWDANEFHRRELAQQYELFRRSDHPPFAIELESPYRYRAYDLTHGETPNAILVADIHT